MQASHREVTHAIKNKAPLEGLRTGKERNAKIVVDGKLVSRVTFPKIKGGHVSSMSPKTLGVIRSQLCLSKESFKDFIKCPLKKEGYIALLREKGYL